MKIALIISAMMFTAAQPVIAESVSVMEPMPWIAQFGVCGLLGGILWWMIAKTLPQMHEVHTGSMQALAESSKECNDALKEELKGLRDDVNRHQSDNHQLLRETLACKP